MEYTVTLGKRASVGLESTLARVVSLEHGSPQVPVFSSTPRSSHSSYVDEDCDSLALCDPMQRVNCEVDSLPESCFDSGLSTLRDSNEYDSEVEYKHQRAFPRSHGMRESIAGDASDTDVSSGNHCSPRLILHRDLAPCSTLICHGNPF